MKTKVVSFFRLFFIIAVIEIVLFILMMFFVMTDESIGVFGKILGFIVENILSFPLTLLNREYPFFMDSPEPPSYMILLIILNLLIQTCLVTFIQKLICSK